MKKNKILQMISLAILISACGASSNSSDNSATQTKQPTTTTSTTTDILADRVFPADNPWNQDVSNEFVDSNSATLINSLGAGFLHPDFGTWWDGAPNGQPYVVVSGTQPKVPVVFDYPTESEPGPYPIPLNAPIQGGPNGTGDRHVIVIDKDNHKLYELFNAFPQSDGSWKATSGAVFDLNTNNLRPVGWTSADAAGLPIYPGLVRYEDVVQKKEIDHALRFTANRTRSAYIYPARHAAGVSNDPSLPPMGMRVRLKASFDISKYSANVQVILRAMKKYGMILADNGTSWMFSGVPNDNWNDQELHTLTTVPGSAFEVIKMSTLQN
jgi:hypothetical protein